jgi:hypothetical protein
MKESPTNSGSDLRTPYPIHRANDEPPLRLSLASLYFFAGLKSGAASA